MEDDKNKEQRDREKIEGIKELDITAELIKLYQQDPISNKVIQYLLAKYKIIPLNAVESIKQHREEILLNIVLCYRKLWGMRGKVIKKVMETSDKPIKIIIKRKEGKGDDQGWKDVGDKGNNGGNNHKGRGIK